MRPAYYNGNMSIHRELGLRTKIVLFAAGLASLLYILIVLFARVILAANIGHLAVIIPLLAAGLILAIVIASAFARVISKYVISPVKKLAETMRQFSAKDFSARAEVPDSNDETAELARDFNAMAEVIEEFSKNLEELVISRTKQLTQAYNALQSQTDEISKDLKMAKRVQHKIVPAAQDMPGRTELAFGAYYGAMANVGGDLYDAIRIGKNSYGFLMADVSGHGVPAALIASMVKMAFHSKASWGIDPKDVCGSVNDELLKVMSETDLYVTVFYAILDLETGGLRYSNCGHHCAILIRKGGGTIDLDTEGTFLGFFENAEYHSAAVKMGEGDRLLLFTDGIPEAFNHFQEQYGDERIQAYIERTRNLAPGPFIDGLILDLENFTMGAKQSDDRSVLLIEFIQKTATGNP